jgi:hypothetical protein
MKATSCPRKKGKKEKGKRMFEKGIRKLGKSEEKVEQMEK